MNVRLGFDKTHPIENLSKPINYGTQLGKVAENEMKPGIKRKQSTSRFDTVNQTSIFSERNHFSVLLSQNEPLDNSKGESGGNVKDLPNDDSVKLQYQSLKWIPQKSWIERTNCTSSIGDLHTQRSKLDKKIVSVRSR